jgi:Tol biopolymer transport system component
MQDGMPVRAIRTSKGQVVRLLLLSLALVGLSMEHAAGQGATDRIHQKVQEIEKLLPNWVVSGGSPDQIGPRMERFQQMMQSDKTQEAEAQLDEVLTLLRTTKKAQDLPEGRTVPVKEPYRGPVKKVKLASLPFDAAIVFIGPRRDVSRNELPGTSIYAMDADGTKVTQITFDEKPLHRELAAASPDRTKIAENRYIADRPTLWVLDLQHQTEAQLVPHFSVAGGSSMVWDQEGYIFFTGSQEPGMFPHTTDVGPSLYKIRADGTSLVRLTTSRSRQAVADPGISAEGTLLTYLLLEFRKTRFGSPEPTTQIYAINTDGSNNHLVVDLGKEKAHDPAPSADHRQVVFSRPNPDFVNFRGIQGLNTAHDLYIINMDGTGLRKLTAPGPISIVPDWSEQGILYTEIHEADEYKGLTLIQPDGHGKKRMGPRGSEIIKGGGVHQGAFLGSWILKRSVGKAAAAPVH